MRKIAYYIQTILRKSKYVILQLTDIYYDTEGKQIESIFYNRNHFVGIYLRAESRMNGIRRQ